MAVYTFWDPVMIVTGLITISRTTKGQAVPNRGRVILHFQRGDLDRTRMGQAVPNRGRDILNPAPGIKI